jgi:glycerophosphoryl diester phosphodiesterase
MKFGKTLRVSVFESWSAYYIDYKRLKQVLRSNIPNGNGNPSDISDVWDRFDSLLRKYVTVTLSFYEASISGCESVLDAIVEELALKDMAAVLVTSTAMQTRTKNAINMLSQLSEFYGINYTALRKIAKKWQKRHGLQQPLPADYVDSIWPLADKQREVTRIGVLLSQLQVLLLRLDVSGPLTTSTAASGGPLGKLSPSTRDQTDAIRDRTPSVLSLLSMDSESNLFASPDGDSIPTTPDMPHGVAYAAMIARQLTLKGDCDELEVLLKENADDALDILRTVGDDGRSLLHISAFCANLDILALLLSYPTIEGIIDIGDVEDRTALHEASMNGHLECVELLLSKGANPMVKDSTGWTARDESLYAGYMKVSSALKQYEGQWRAAHPQPLPVLPKPLATAERIPSTTGDGPPKPNLIEIRAPKKALQPHQLEVILTFATQPIKGYGPFSTGINAICVYKVTDPVCADSEKQLLAEVSTPIPEDFADVVVPLEQSVESCRVHLLTHWFLIEVNGSNGIFQAHCYVGPRHLTQSCDIISLDLYDKTGCCVGELTLEYSMIWPFPSSTLPSHYEGQSYAMNVTVIGHRGAGSSSSVRAVYDLQQEEGSSGGDTMTPQYRRSHFRENTILSFVTAASLGANYIEFDVQLSSDSVPVIYHDYRVPIPKSNVTMAIDQLTAKQFLSLGDPAEHSGRSRSAGKIRHDEDVLSNGKVESVVKKEKEQAIQDSLTSFEKMFKVVPENVGFNVELKYPNSMRRLREKLHPMDRNLWLDKVLDVVFRLAGKRSILFSTFDSNIARMCHRKQAVYPVFFLTAAGMDDHWDNRGASLKHALRFAKSAELPGLVSHCEPILEAPALIDLVKNNGVVLFTYGAPNNSIENCRMQKFRGVDAVIVDHVFHISKNLQ